MTTKPLIRRYTDEQGNDMVAVAAWFYDQIIECLPDEAPVIEGLDEAINKIRSDLDFRNLLYPSIVTVFKAARAYQKITKVN